MATPIKITPQLSGRQSEYFNKKLAETSSKRVSSEEKGRIMSLVTKVLSNTKSK